MKLIIPLVACLLLLSAIPAAAQKNFYNAGMKKYEQQDYQAAIDLFMGAYKKATRAKKGDCLFMIAECYREMNQYEKAASYYEKALLANCVQKDLAEKYLAMMREKLKK